MKWIIRLLKLGFFLSLLVVVGLFSGFLYQAPNLPAIDMLKDAQFQVPLRVFSADGKLIAEFGEKRRIPITYNDLPNQMVHAFISAEDDRFFEHPGVDYQGLVRAVIQLALTGKKKQGGSTITMQVARNFFLTPEKSYERKINEILLALKIERKLTKQQILALYLNKIYLGNRAYGVGAAAQIYYGKTLDQLSLAEVATIAGLPKAPSTNNPIINPTRAKIRRNYVLKRMHELNYISQAEFDQAKKQTLTAKIHQAKIELDAPYVAEMVRAELYEQFGEETYTHGYKVTTTIKSRLQTAGDLALKKALQEYDYRHGYRGIIKHYDLNKNDNQSAWDKLLNSAEKINGLPIALVIEIKKQSILVYSGEKTLIEIPWKDLKWTRKSNKQKTASSLFAAGDLIRIYATDNQKEKAWRIAQLPEVQGALISLNPNSGGINSLVGGYDFYQSKFNRVTQAQRQPGSGFKAFIYSAALSKGMTAATLINDAPVVFKDASLEGDWRPENYSGKFFGLTRIRYALTKSRNLVSIRLLRRVTIAYALKYAERFGFDATKLPPNLSLSLGSASVTPLQMATGYSVLANGGFKVNPYLIQRITNHKQHIIYLAAPYRACHSCKQSVATEYLAPNTQPIEIDTFTDEALVDLDKNLLDKPIIEIDPAPLPANAAPRTITPANHYLMNSMMRDVIQRGTATKAKVLKRSDLAGKTGTTNDQRDAWFNGFNNKIVANVWVGFDSNKKLGRGEVGGKAALPAWIYFMQEALKGMPETPLTLPEGMVQVSIDPKTGNRAHPDQKTAIIEYFRKENIPAITNTAPIILPDGSTAEPNSGDVSADIF